ncbi:hypothetical protein C8Q73DRAFT_685135 [Cubamyces lactineus]|nr:hypothetical protein C8Q73DRAFT_685135 [Cubamyces lactineus]
MTDTSDTESEPSQSVDGWEAADFVQMSTELGRINGSSLVGPRQVLSALKTLQGLDICAVESDERLHGTIQCVSSTVLSFLDRVVTAGDSWSATTSEDFALTLPILLNETTLSLLLQYRVLFRDIASRDPEASTSAITVCWVDVIFARLGQAILRVAGACNGVQPFDSLQPEAVRAQREDDMLRAATQLPERWHDIVNLICSDYVSPAALRLAFSLVWGLHILTVQLAGHDDLLSEVTAELFPALNRRVKRITDKLISRATMESTERERIGHAILVSLYAKCDFVDSEGQSPCRPQSHATLLEMIRIVLHPDTPCTSPPSIPATRLDLPQSILLKWGHTLPWAWATWRDPRLYQADVVESLTAAWLFHLDAPLEDVPFAHSVEWYDEGLVDALEPTPSAALSMLLRILQQSVNAARDEPATLDAVLLDVTLKACWGVKHILQLSDIEDAALSPICGIVIELFVALGDRETELNIKDLILEVISSSPTALQRAVDLATGLQSRYAFAWEQKLRRVHKSVATAIVQEDDIEDMPDLHDIRQTLQFLTLTARSDSTPTTFSDLPQRVLLAVFDLLESEHMDSPAWTMLGDAAIFALAQSPHHASFRKSTSRTERARWIWRLVQEVDPSDLPLAASLATYISATAGTYALDALNHGEAWDFIRDVLLLILNRDFEGQEEPLALLVAPAACRALVELVRHASPTAKRYYVSSPWTLSMVARLQQLEIEEGSDGEDYHRIVASLVTPYKDAILCELEVIIDPTKEPRIDRPNESDEGNITFCWVRSRACLIQT